MALEDAHGVLRIIPKERHLLPVHQRSVESILLLCPGSGSRVTQVGPGRSDTHVRPEFVLGVSSLGSNLVRAVEHESGS